MPGQKRKPLLILFAFVFVLTGCNILWNERSDKSKNKDLSLYTIMVKEGKLPSLITSSGELQAERSLNVNPFRQGIIEEIYVSEGDEVLKNQLLAKIEGRDIQFRLNIVQTDFENSKAAFQRREQLFLEGGISKEKYEDFRKAFLISKAKLNQVQVEEKELFIRSPLKGIITARYAEPGTFVSPNSSLSNSENSGKSSVVEISQGLEVISKVPESDIGRIQIGRKGRIQVEAFPDERFDSIVTEIAPRAIRKNNVTSFEVKLSLVNPPKKLRIGMTADIEFQTGKSGFRTIVPTVAIVTENGTPGVLVVDQNKEPFFQKVELGSSSGDKTAILNGINPGEKIFIDIPPWSKKKRK